MQSLKNICKYNRPTEAEKHRYTRTLQGDFVKGKPHEKIVMLFYCSNQILRNHLQLQ